MMHIQCQHCSRGFDAPYWQLGMLSRCPHCGNEKRLTRECVLGYQESGWAVTFLDFVRLVTDPACQPDVLPLLRSFGYECVDGKRLLFRDAQGKTLTAEEVHTQIQHEEPKQHRLYQTAMDLWR
jgi:hypothetical protein